MVTSMLEKTIEIEGLLRIIRDGSPLPETYKLLNAKTASLATEATALAAEAENRLKKEEAPKQETPEADFVMAHPAPEAETPKVDFTAAETAPKEQPLIIRPETAAAVSTTAPDLAEADLDLEEEDDIILSFDDVPEQTSMTEETQTVIDTSLEASIPVTEETFTEETFTDETIPQETVSKESPAEEETKATPEPPQSEDPETAEETKGSKRQTRLKAAFSLNDRFLYARELFNGNMKIFDSTLEFIEGIDDYSLVEDYFYSELEWDPENANVASFMEILRPQFKE